MLEYLKRLYINPCINFILTIILFQVVVNIDWAFSYQFVIIYSIFCIIINLLTFLVALRKLNNSWKSYLISFILYILFTILIILIRLIFGNGGIAKQDENNAEGMVLIVIYLLSIPNLLIGNILALVFNKYRIHKDNQFKK